jgi:hypothetical protein
MSLVSVLAIALLAAGCVDGGPRRLRLEPTVGVDASGQDVVVLPRFMCSGSIAPLDCAAPFTLPADGHVTDFSGREWNSGSGKWCNEGGVHGATFSFKGNAPTDSNAISVNTEDASLRLSLTVASGSYGGGGLAFESGCLNASAFTGVQFTVAVASGSLTGCSYQLQLQTFEQRPISQSPPGGCDINTTSCYGFPAAANLPAPSTDITMPTRVSIPFTSFGASQMMPTPEQIVGLQWQVNSSSGTCTVELRLDDVAFIPAAPSGSDDAGT